MKTTTPVLLLGLACFSFHASAELFAGTKQFSETTGDWAARSSSLDLAIVPAPDRVAASANWKDSGFTDSNWNVANNWSTNAIPGTVSTSDGSADIATFKFGNNLSVTVDATRSISTIIFSGALEGAYTLQGGGLYVGFNGSISVNSSVTHIETVNSPIFLATTPNTTYTFNNESTNGGASLNIGGAVTGRQAVGGMQTLVLGGAGNGIVSGLISNGSNGGSVQLLKSGAGRWTLSAANSYSGSTTVATGTLRMGTANALPSTTAVVVGASPAPGPATLDLNGHNQTIGSLQVKGGSSLGSSAVVLGGGVLTVAGGISFVGLRPGTISGSGAIDLGGGVKTISIADGGNSAFGFDLQISSNIQNGGINKTGAGTLGLSAANTFAGETTIASGKILIGHDLALQNSTLNYNNGGGTIGFGVTSATLGGLAGNQGLGLSTASNAAVALKAGNNNQNTIYSGVLSGTGSLAKVGNGTLTLTGSNSYSGTTAVNGGTLLLNNAAALTASSAVTVNNSGSVLGGSGTISRPITVGPGAIIQGGTGVDGTTLTVSGSLTLADNSLIQLALGPDGAHSTLARTGSSAWTFATGQIFSFLDLGAEQGTYQDIISGLSAAPNTSPSNWTISNPGWHGTFVYDGAGHIDLVLDTIATTPEPGTWFAGALALGALAWRQAVKVRRKKDESGSGGADRRRGRGRRSSEYFRE